MNFKQFLDEEYLLTIKTFSSNRCEIWKNPVKTDFKNNLIRAFLIKGNIYAWDYNSGFHEEVWKQFKTDLKINDKNVIPFYGNFKPINVWSNEKVDIRSLVDNKNIIKLFGNLEVVSKDELI
jgi:hypothetical protein